VTEESTFDRINKEAARNTKHASLLPPSMPSDRDYARVNRKHPDRVLCACRPSRTVEACAVELARIEVGRTARLGHGLGPTVVMRVDIPTRCYQERDGDLYPNAHAQRQARGGLEIRGRQAWIGRIDDPSQLDVNWPRDEITLPQWMWCPKCGQRRLLDWRDGDKVPGLTKPECGVDDTNMRA
jgi:hypothetical protein